MCICLSLMSGVWLAAEPAWFDYLKQLYFDVAAPDLWHHFPPNFANVIEAVFQEYLFIL